ncbi:MAG TPA: BamA/TamA family outer membrane protein [Polyangiaceae bacterium]|nr:BamA/TamA family outer membrane protein [Polyangiaceae bacterium]
MPKLTPPIALRRFVPALAAFSCGCASIPAGRAAIDSIELVGVKALDPGDVAAKLATEESPRFLGLFQGGLANDYSIYDAAVLQRDLARVERYYRGHGFFEARARVGRVEYVRANHVRIQIVVDEGAPVLNAGVVVDGVDSLPALAGAARRAGREALPRAERFNEDRFKAAQATVLHELTDHGYAYATVQANARVDLASHAIDYVFDVTPGIKAVFGPISFIGLDPDGAGPEPQEIEESILRRVLHVRQGAPYSTAELAAATQALLDLEVFSAAHIVPGLSDPSQPVVPLVVQLEPTKLRALRLGGGAEFDNIKTEAHAIVGWEDHNFLGDLRDLSIDFTPGLVFFPTNVSDPVAPTDFFPEERLRVQLRQPGFLEARTTGFLRPSFNVYPLLVEDIQPAQVPSTNVVGYVEPKLSLGLERRFGKHLFGTLAYDLQGEDPFFYKGPCSDGACATLPPPILLSFPQLTAQLDFRDSAVHPHTGFQANADVQVAGLGGTAEDVRIQPDVEGYLPIAHGVTFAVTGGLGLLFPFNYGTSITELPTTRQLILDPFSPKATNLDIETLYFRGFASGGPSSNRGYPLRGVAPHGYVPFLNPSTASAQVANGCNPQSIIGTCLSPIGGFTMWQASIELRLDIAGPLGFAVFCDTGDVSQFVFPKKYSLRFDYLHMSCGAGARYDTPVGPIRLDIAYRIPPLQIVGPGIHTETEAFEHDATFGVPPLLFGVLPMAIAFGIGEAF